MEAVDRKEAEREERRIAGRGSESTGLGFILVAERRTWESLKFSGESLDVLESPCVLGVLRRPKMVGESYETPLAWRVSPLSIAAHSRVLTCSTLPRGSIGQYTDWIIFYLKVVIIFAVYGNQEKWDQRGGILQFLAYPLRKVHPHPSTVD